MSSLGRFHRGETRSINSRLRNGNGVRSRLSASAIRSPSFERLESRNLLANDLELFSYRLHDVLLAPTDADVGPGTGGEFGASWAALQQMATWVGSQMDFDVTTMGDAILSASLRGTIDETTWGDLIESQLLNGEPLAAEAPEGVELVYQFSWNGMEWDFRAVEDGMEFVELEGAPYHNAEAPVDIDADGLLAPIDALLVINHLNSAPTAFLPNRVPPEMEGVMFDVTGDRWVTPQDALFVINSLNGEPTFDVDLAPALQDDYFLRLISATAAEYPVSDIDVLENDGDSAEGSDLRVVAVGPASLGAVEIIGDSVRAGRTLVRYTPGPQFGDFDFFTYTVEDASGNRAVATVYVDYQVEVGELSPFSVIAPIEVAAPAAGEPIAFRDAAGNGLISVRYEGDAPMTVGVLLSFQPNEPPFGQSTPGTLSSDATASDAAFYALPTGEAWITGSIEQVNEILARLRFEPAPGYSAPSGLGLNVNAFLYTSLGASAGFATSVVSLIVPADPLGPLANPDFFEFNRPARPLRLDVLANDASPTGSPLRLVSVSRFPADAAGTVETSFGTSIELDLESNEIVVDPGAFALYESFVYVVSDADGRLAQGQVAFSIIE